MIDFLLTLKVNDYRIITFVWNIFLALIPCFIAYRLSSAYYLKKWKNIHQFNQILFILTFLLWFFFFPNTAYLISDIRHLANYCDDLGAFRMCKAQAWVVPVFFTYAFIGVPAFYYALKRMTEVIKKLFGKWMGRIFPLLMIPLTAMGLLLGLVARFNSWEIISHPLDIVLTAINFLKNKNMFNNFISYTIMLYILYYMIDLMLKKRR